jgi:hypothetical protein
MVARTGGYKSGAPYTSQFDLGLDKGPEPGIEGRHSQLTLSLGDIEGKRGFLQSRLTLSLGDIEGTRGFLQCPQVFHRCAYT